MVQFLCFCIGKMQKISPPLSGYSDFFKGNMNIFSCCLLCRYFFAKKNPFWSLRIHRSATHTTKKKNCIFHKNPPDSVYSKQHRQQLTPKKCVSHFIKFGLFSRFFMAKKGFEVCICVSLFVQLSMNCPKQASNAPSNAFIGILILLRFVRTEKGKSGGGDLGGLKEDDGRLQNWTGGDSIHFHRYFIGSVSFSIQLFPPWTSIIESSFREIKAV